MSHWTSSISIGINMFWGGIYSCMRGLTASEASDGHFHILRDSNVMAFHLSKTEKKNCVDIVAHRIVFDLMTSEISNYTSKVCLAIQLILPSLPKLSGIAVSHIIN